MSHQPEIFIEIKDFPVLLKTRIAQAKCTIAEFSEKLGVTPKLIYYLLDGKRAPSEAILEALGARFVIAVGSDSAVKKVRKGKKKD